MIDISELNATAEKLRVYDVEQGGWEGESGAYRDKAGHVLKHLVKNTFKAFDNPKVAWAELAPDSVQHALRLMRWSGLPYTAAVPTKHQADAVRKTARSQPGFGDMPLAQVAYQKGYAALAAGLHDEDHESTRAAAEERRSAAAQHAGRLLVYSAELQAQAFEFDLLAAVDDRLTVLRERFDISEPVRAD